MKQKPDLTPKEVGQILGKEKETIRKNYIPMFRKQNLVRCYKLKGQWHIDRHDFNKWHEGLKSA